MEGTELHNKTKGRWKARVFFPSLHKSPHIIQTFAPLLYRWQFVFFFLELAKKSRCCPFSCFWGFLRNLLFLRAIPFKILTKGPITFWTIPTVAGRDSPHKHTLHKSNKLLRHKLERPPLTFYQTWQEKWKKWQNNHKSPIAGVPTGEECLGRMYWCKVSTKMAMGGYSRKL